ncbi:hypothetical protein AC579_10401 [Pseudocercospora musae]|uniref:Uncharacterized protein n=1 Tax=Pseudocercospora musae TaxID=113226 RepID=A0A139IM57_9PEZI|nr:hypothetical protein AC579_10401 [Pseudocercospora musae]
MIIHDLELRASWYALCLGNLAFLLPIDSTSSPTTMANIKREPLDEDFYEPPVSPFRSSYTRMTSRDFSSPFQRSSTPVESNRGYLAKRSLAVQKFKQSDNEIGLHGQVFETTGFIVNGMFVLEASHMIFDTTASSTFISTAAAQAARLRVMNCPPKNFDLADGTTVTHSKYTEFKIYIAGVDQTIKAYVEQHHTGHHMLVGINTIRQFQGQANLTFGRKQETRWSIAQNQTGLRKTRYVLREDSPVVLPTLYVHAYTEGMRLARSAGETASQRKSREVLERHENRGRRLRQRHEHRAGPRYKGGARGDWEGTFD